MYDSEMKPFAMNIDSSLPWLGDKQQEILARMRSGVLDNKGFLLLTGVAGSGKTTLLQALTARLDRDIAWAVIDDPSLEKIDFYNAIAGKFGVEESFTSKVRFLLQMSQFLHKAADEKKKVLLLIDDCHLLRQEMLDELRRLTSIKKAGVGLLHIFFVGQLECKDLLMQPKNRPVMQRLTHVTELSPLNITETGDYIHHRLKIAGIEEPLFTAQAVQMVHRFAQGNPRRINALCDQALAAGSAQAAETIDAQIIASCADSSICGAARQSSSFTGAALTPSPWRGSVKYGLGLLLLCLVGIAFWWPGSDALQGVPPDPPAIVSTLQDEMPQVEVPRLEDVSPIDPLPPVIVFKTIAGEVTRPDTAERTPAEKIRPEEEAAALPIITEAVDPPAEQTAAVESVAPPLEEIEVKALAAPEVIKIARTLEKKMVGMTPMAPPTIRLALRANSLELTAAARKELDGFVAHLGDSSQARLVVKGFVSAKENSPENIKLSEERALHVREILLAKGIDADRIEVVGMGNKEPLASNATSAGRKKNRRVEVHVIPTGQ